MKKALILTFFLLSCTHWLIETQTRIQVRNSTKYTISDLCIVSKSGQKIVLVPGSIEPKKESKIYEVELVGEFDFEISARDSLESLGTHKLKGGSLLAEITEKGGKFEMELK